LRIAIAGAAGRMGRTLIAATIGSDDMQLGAALEAPGSPMLGRDAGELVGHPCGVKIAAALAPASGIDCLIDFTVPEATLAQVNACLRTGTRMVIGTTGFSREQADRIASAADKIAIVKAPSMSVGVNVAFSLAEKAARVLGDEYDVEIIEAHHKNKIDAPSGTALKFGEMIARALGRDLATAAVHGRHGTIGVRGRKAIGFHAIRAGDIVGDHTVMFAGEGERLEIIVRSGSRSTYAAGALRAARYLMDKERGLYDMQDVLGLR
jgi:4-hydroxy-tetrahydrodipicolinate reductase